MTTLTRVRLALLAVGVAFFIWALRTGDEWARWAAIAIIAVAIIVRFFDPARSRRR